MGKLISRRVFLDYNSTSPLSKSVKSWLEKGDVFFANPSSLHSSGKRSKKAIREVTDYLKNYFGLKSFNLFYHSGATEGINTVIKGYAKILKGKVNYFYSETDHAASRSLKEYFLDNGHNVHAIEVDRNGDFDEGKLISRVKTFSNVILNFTYVNNETGVVWDLEKAKKIKKQTSCFIHVDSSQSPGKIEGWKNLKQDIDAYTFSGHKFGSLKGVGFTFLKAKTIISPLIVGGGQQGNLRSGTENVQGIYSLKLALSDLLDSFKTTETNRIYIEKKLEEELREKIEIVAKGASKRCSNTICFIVKGTKSDSIVAKLDIAGLEVASGSACSSGVNQENHVIKEMGHSEIDSKSVIRISFELDLDKESSEIYASRLVAALS